MNNIQVISALPEEWGDSHCDNLSFSGCGKINATIKTMQIIKRTQPKLIINYGTGASKNYSGLVDCTRFIQRDMDATPLGFKKGDTPYDTDVPNMISFATLSNPIGKNLTCYTGDTFETNISQYDDVVDMEAYAIAKVCYIYGVDFVSFKYISDDGNPDDWKNFMAEGSKKFKEVLEIMKAD